MYRKRTLYLLAAFLVFEAIVIVAIPARMPRAVRAIGAGVNLVAAAGVILIARNGPKPETG